MILLSELFLQEYIYDFKKRFQYDWNNKRDIINIPSSPKKNKLSKEEQLEFDLSKKTTAFIDAVNSFGNSRDLRQNVIKVLLSALNISKIMYIKNIYDLLNFSFMLEFKDKPSDNLPVLDDFTLSGDKNKKEILVNFKIGDAAYSKSGNISCKIPCRNEVTYISTMTILDLLKFIKDNMTDENYPIFVQSITDIIQSIFSSIMEHYDHLI